MTGQLTERKGAGRTLRASVLTLVRAVLIFIVASLALFSAVEFMPEDPVSLRIKNPDPDRVAEIRQNLGLNDPVAVRYGRYLVDFIRLDWGKSLISGRPVREEVGRFLPATLELAAMGILWGTLGGAALVLAAHATGWRWLIQPVRGLAALGLTVPIFWIGILFILLFGVTTGWLPVGGRYDFQYPPPDGTGFFVLDSLLAGDWQALQISLRHLALPVLTLGLYPAAVVAGTMEARLNQSFVHKLVTSLQSRGYGPFRIWGVHVARLVSGPVVTVVGTQAGALLGGAVLTETVFSWPGMGRFLVDGVLNRDLFIIRNGLLLMVVLALLLVTLADLLAARLDHQLAHMRESS